MDVNNTNNGFSLASLILGITSIVFICCGGFVFGALGIVFAILSRGANAMSSQAKVGLGLSIGAFVISLIAVPIMLFSYIANTHFASEFQNRFREEFDRSYNETYDDIWEDFDDEYDFFNQYESGFGDT